MVVVGGGFVQAEGSGFVMNGGTLVGKAVTNSLSLLQISRWQIYDEETGRCSASDQ